MRLISYTQNGQQGVGVMVDDKGFVALSKAAPDLPKSLKAILALPNGLDKARDAAKGKKADATIDQVELLPVIPDPQAIWCLALNYKEHIEETGLTTNPDYPHIFLRVPCSQVGHEQPLVKHTHTQRVRLRGRARRHHRQDRAPRLGDGTRRNTSPAMPATTKGRCANTSATTAISASARTSRSRAASVPG